MPTVKPTMKPSTLIAASFAALLSVLVFWAPLIGLLGCSEVQAPEDCSDAALAELEGKFATELLLTCSDYRSVAECPGAPDVIAKYDGLRKEWTECR